MLAWLSANLVNIALILVIALVVVLLIRGMIRDKKAGKSSCGGNCASCGVCGYPFRSSRTLARTSGIPLAAFGHFFIAQAGRVW